ncbi:MAG: hypothetical protein ACKOQM_11885 [Novosphingobium sp.]
MAQSAVPAPTVAAVTADGLEMPKLDFTPTPEIESDYEKYFYFHRADTTFVEAYTDIRECDALASGSRIYLGGDSAMMNSAIAQYGLGGAIGGALGSVLADAIFGSAQRRKERRVKMRNCMGFKGYQRYGLAKELWDPFNFQEGNGRKKEEERDRKMRLQALVASGPAPKQEALAK